MHLTLSCLTFIFSNLHVKATDQLWDEWVQSRASRIHFTGLGREASRRLRRVLLHTVLSSGVSSVALHQELWSEGLV